MSLPETTETNSEEHLLQEEHVVLEDEKENEQLEQQLPIAQNQGTHRSQRDRRQLIRYRQIKSNKIQGY